MSFNQLPESNGLQGADLARYLLSDFTFHVKPKLELKLVYDKVSRLQSQNPEARINLFLVDFLFDAGQSVDVVMAELTRN